MEISVTDLIWIARGIFSESAIWSTMSDQHSEIRTFCQHSSHITFIGMIRMKDPHVTQLALISRFSQQSVCFSTY
ncbi:hypothetical protein MPTK1_5g07470 [Marchantia polymorpha subsp. ruderalis]|uniref:Uncharacterized protein n=2 Tax=Marchantia polymorpha TaxID=3197 RepID=A0AAF6BFX6_MARPO|nr:hypothetical protein MARPO_0127s0037 [Marchantia polymorpha]BBN10910.1 hypothetical protein Mp_5g07470 [Marchantia polymorpha subsp. ruderalis]|eukprot:PTQ30254.1 hypothetical protein MARPO_0127s0037 [Marchantia polymorpha]